MRDLQVVYTDTNGNLRAGFNSATPGTVTDTNLIAQKFLINMNTLFGSNAFLQEKGNNFYRLVGGNFSKGDEQRVRALLSLAVDQTATQIIDEQNADNSIPDYQRLAKVEIVSIIYDSNSHSWYISVRMTMANNSTTTLKV